MQEKDYSAMGDGELVRLSNEGDSLATHALVKRYDELIRYETRSFFIQGGDMEDLHQEGFIGLVHAIRDYRDDRNTAFKTFAQLCIVRQILSAVQTASRKKHGPLNNYLSFSTPANPGSDMDLGDFLGSGEGNPLEAFIEGEAFNEYHRRIEDALTPLERAVLKLYLQGRKYFEIAHDIGRDVKAVDNALQRIRRKLDSL